MTLQEEVTEACFAYFVEAGEPATVRILAEICERSESTIRRVLRELGGGPDGCDYDPVETPVREKNYGTVIRYRRTDAFSPSKRLLAERLRTK
jgi:hypothetical protein